MGTVSPRFYLSLLIIAFGSTACMKGFKSSSLSQVTQSSSQGTQSPVKITGPAEGAASKGTLTIQGSCVNGVNITFSGDISNVAPIPCSNGTFSAQVSLTTGDGMKTVVVTQEQFGAFPRTVHSRSFLRDTTAPALTIVAPATNSTVKNSVVLHGTCENGLDVIINNTSKVTCANAMFATTMPLNGADGPITLTLTQTDAAGNATTASLSLMKDSVAPTVTITSPVANTSHPSSNISVAGACETGVAVVIAGTGISAPVTGSCTGGAYSVAVVFSSGSGTKAVTATQTDAAGNVGSATSSFQFAPIVAAPVVAISAPAANTVFKTNVTVSGTCQNGLAVTFSGTGWSAPANTSCTNGAFSAAITFTNGDGAKNLIASQTNSSGVTGSASRTFVKDATAPALAIVSPAANTAAKTGVTLMGTCESGLTVAISGAGVAASTNVACANGAFSSAITFSAGDGVKAVQVAQTDAASNSGTATRNFQRDTVAPTIAITQPNAGTADPAGLTIAGTCETGLNVTASGTGLASSVSGACANAMFTFSIVFSAGDGTKDVQVTQTDAAGNAGSNNRSFVRAAAVLDGALLYAQNCSGCHNPLANSTKRGKTAAQITNALATITPMQALSLTSAQVNAIAAALAVPVVEMCVSQAQPGHVPLHRINKAEYSNAVASLLGISGLPGQSLPEENTLYGFSNMATALTVTPTSIERYLEAAEAAVTQAFTTNAAGIFNCNGAAVSPTTLTRACAEQILTRISQSAFRRPLTTAEGTQVKGFLDKAVAEGQSLQEGVRWGLEWLLVTPSFLFRSIQHPAPNDPNNVKTLTGYELASRLSFFLWSSQPDQSLLDAATAGTLVQSATLEAQVTRMLADPKAKALIDNFAMQWLELHKFEHHVVDTSVYAFNENLRQDMITETNMLLQDVFQKNVSPMKLLSSDTSYLNKRLATHYGLSGPTSDSSFIKTNVASTERRGILGQGSVLMLTSISNRTSVVKRGKWILDNILCEPPADPPSDIEIGNLPGDPGGSLKDKMEAHRTNPVCASCHNSIDPMGFALEGFDANAVFRTKYRDGTNVDSTGTLPDGKPVAGALDLNRILQNDPRYKVCITKKLMTYALGREVQEKDQCTVNRLATQNVGETLPLSSLVKAIVTSDPFRKQAGEGAP